MLFSNYCYVMTADSVVLYNRCTASATVQSVQVHAHIVCVYFLCTVRRPTLILSNVWEIFQHFQKLGTVGQRGNIACPFDV